MLFPIRPVLLASFLALSLVMVLGQTLVLDRGLREELLAFQKRELSREMDLASAYLESLGPVGPDSAARALTDLLGYPVALLDEFGRVEGASGVSPFRGEEGQAPQVPPEVVEAREGRVGFSERLGYDDAAERLFAARGARVGGRDYVLQVAVPLDEMRMVFRSRFWSSIGLLVPATALAVLFTVLLATALRRPLHEMRRWAEGLAGGQFFGEVSGPIRVRELHEVAETLHWLSEELEDRYRYLERERGEMQVLLDRLGEAAIALTENARVLRTNKAAIKLLSFPEDATMVPVGTLVHDPALRTLLENSVVNPFSGREITLGDRSLIVSATPVDGGGVVVTFLDVTEIRRLEIVRRDFVANASHELKTPLTAMRGYAETLLEDDPPDNLRRDFLRAISANTLRLQNLVDDLLDLSRLESGGWLAKREEVGVKPLISELWQDFRGRAEEKGLSFHLDGDALVYADEQGLEQVIQNLIENAVQYTPQGGSVSVTVREEGPMARVEVRDTGIGIPSSALARIFERFYRVDAARSRMEGGTGLGLAIVRHLVEAMGGRVWAESELGQGTSIILTLPAVSLPTGA